MRQFEKEHLRRVQIATQEALQEQCPCLYPGCGSLSVWNHSQWEKGVLANIAVDGRVVALKNDYIASYKHRYGGHLSPQMDTLSIGKASGFNGFCQKHDTGLFLPIERQKVDLESHKQVLCYHLRALAHAFSSKRFETRIMEIYCSRFEHETDCSRLKKNLHLLQTRNEAFENSLLNPLFEEGVEMSINYCWRTIPEVVPVSNVSIFCPVPIQQQSLEYSRHPESQFAVATFSLLPMQRSSEAIMTYNQEATPFMDYYINEFMNRNPLRLIRFLNRMVFNYSEDFCCNPNFWNMLEPKTRKKIQEHIVAINGAEQKLSTLQILDLSDKTKEALRCPI